MADSATVMSTSTRNFPNRMGKDSNVYLGSAELAAVCADMGTMPTVEEYMQMVAKLDTMADDIYRYLNFHQMQDFIDQANTIKLENIA